MNKTFLLVNNVKTKSFLVNTSVNKLFSNSTRSFCCNNNDNAHPHFHAKMTAEEMLSIHEMHAYSCMRNLHKQPLMIRNGKLQYVWDIYGKRYLDMFAGIVTTGVGHCHPKLVETLSKQLNKLWHTTNIYLNEEILDYIRKLASRLPENLSQIYLCNSGSEANDIAITLARLYTRSFDVIALRNAYHGCSIGTMGLCGIGSWKQQMPGGFGIFHTVNPDPFRGKFRGKYCRDSISEIKHNCDCHSHQCRANEQYLDEFDDLLNSCLPKRIAGFIAESIQGVGGVVQYPKDFLKEVAKKVRQRGGLLIIDEVQTGFGRTGNHFWGFQNHEITPDIVTMAKSIGNGFPLAAVATSKEIADSIDNALFFNTYGGNPLASRVGSTVLDIIDEEELQDNCHHQGASLINGLRSLMSKFEFIGDVRGKGLMIGVELLNAKNSMDPMSGSDCNDIVDDCKEMGVLIGKGGMFGNVLRIKPPMCIEDTDVEHALEIMEKAFANHANRKSK